MHEHSIFVKTGESNCTRDRPNLWEQASPGLAIEKQAQGAGALAADKSSPGIEEREPRHAVATNVQRDLRGPLGLVIGSRRNRPASDHAHASVLDRSFEGHSDPRDLVVFPPIRLEDDE